VRIGELSRRSGVPLATIKFYLREGVLPPGERTAPNQARYGPEHLRRLRLVRALVEVGGLGVDAVKTVVAALDADLPLHEVLGAAHRALSAAPRLPDDEAAAAALADVGAFLAARGWQVAPDAPSRHDLARVLLALRGLGRRGDVDVLAPYADAADALAAVEIATLADAGDRADAVERVVVGTVLFETALAALRRLAQEHHSAQRFGVAQPPQNHSDDRAARSARRRRSRSSRSM